jgi:4-amino-4-deoxy-L-arabinose transferase-like glycosyltransferase
MMSHASNVVSVTWGSHFDMAWQFWQRPLFSLLLTPGAIISFDAYRLEHLLLASLLAPLAVVLLRDVGTRRVPSHAAGLIVALHPVFVNWGTYGMPDSLMVLWFGSAIVAEGRGRPAVAGALALAAVWTKEIAVFGVVFLLGRSVWRGARAGTTRLWPFHGDRQQTAYVAVLIAAPLPLLYALRLGAPFPGLRTGGASWEVVDQVFLLSWFVPVILAGLAARRSRRVAALCLVFPVFFLLYQFLLRRAVEIWYYVSPGYFSLIAAAFILDAAWTSVRSRTWGLRVGWGATTAALLLLVGLQIAGPVGDPLRDRAVTPLSNAADFNLKWIYDLNHGRDADLFAAFGAVPTDPPPTLLLLDIHSNWALYPLSERTRLTYVDDTVGKVLFNQSIDPVVRAFETTAWTILEKSTNPFSEALQHTYADCLRYEKGPFAVYEGPACAGRRSWVESEYRAARGVAT